ncbi:hypothetical protein MJ561_05155 [Klebsiella pneumoniae]|nr:hypothetical protein MJ561_05155 [Klebsiella pneumoniae]
MAGSALSLRAVRDKFHKPTVIAAIFAPVTKILLASGDVESYRHWPRSDCRAGVGAEVQGGKRAADAVLSPATSAAPTIASPTSLAFSLINPDIIHGDAYKVSVIAFTNVVVARRQHRAG